MAGNRTTSRIAVRPDRIITRRSMPTPMPPVGRHALLERADEVLVVGLRLLVALRPLALLLLEARALIVGVVQLGERVCELHPSAKHSKRSTSPGSERWRFANGDSSTG